METFSVLLTLCAGNSPVTGKFPTQKPETQSFMFSLIWAWINGWVNNREAGDLRRHLGHYDVIVMKYQTMMSDNLFLLPGILIWYAMLFILKVKHYTCLKMDDDDHHHHQHSDITWASRCLKLLATRPVIGGFPTQRASLAESVSISWRHHVRVDQNNWVGLDWIFENKL